MVHNVRLQRMAIALLSTTTVATAAHAQTAACVNDAPNPYHQVSDWAHTSRPWAPTNNVFVDAKDNVWVFDRCEDAGCAASKEAPIWELSPTFGNSRIMKFDKNGKFLMTFGHLGPNE